MAKQKTNTVSDALLADIRETTRRVLGEGAESGGRAIPQGGAGDFWIRISSVDTAAGPNGARVYKCSLYRSPIQGAAAAVANDVLAVSVAEIGNPNVQALPNATWHRTQGRYFSNATDSKVIYVFSPSAELPPGGGKYSVLMKVDDNGTIAWSAPRFT